MSEVLKQDQVIWRRFHRASIDSTQQWALENLDLVDFRAPLIFVADEQTHGYGTRNRRWISGLGGLYLTLVLLPECKDGEGLIEPLSMKVGKILLGLLRDHAGEQRDLLSLKPPNDILCREGKCCGILCQESILPSSSPYFGRSCYVIGIGINLNNPGVITSVVDQQAIDLRSCGICLDREKFLEDLLMAISRHFII
jgi:BirA family biotin operon repressor/biotin-[acetyl-CoA-carboxylase] ligase